MLTIEINRKINPDSVVVNAFRPYSGTKLRKICIDKGLIPKEVRAEDNRVYGAFYNGALSGEELENIRKVFALYVTFPKSRWNDIKIAEKNDQEGQLMFKKFGKEFDENDRNYKTTHMDLHD